MSGLRRAPLLELLLLGLGCVAIGAYSFSLFGEFVHAKGRGHLYLSDFPQHVRVASEALELLRKGELSHPALPLTVYGLSAVLPGTPADAMVWVATGSKLASFLVSVAIFQSLFARPRLDWRAITAAGILFVVSAVRVPGFEGGLTYLNKGSPNIWHNPSNIFVHPIVLALPLLVSLGWKRLDLRLFGASGLLLAVATAIKPNIALFMLPAVVGVLAWTSRERPRQGAIAALLFAGPSTLLLVHLFLLTYSAGGEPSDTIALGLFQTLKIRRADPGANFLIANALPVAVLVRQLWKGEPFERIELLWFAMFVVAYAQFALLYEDGPRMKHGNFAWGYNMCLSYAFLFGIFHFFRYGERRQWVALAVAGVLLLWHLLSGLRVMGLLHQGTSFLRV